MDEGKINSNSTTQGVTHTKGVIPMQINESFQTSQKSFLKKRIAVSRVKRQILKHVWPVRIAIILGILVGFYLLFLLVGFLFGKAGFGDYTGIVSSFLFTPETKIKSLDGRTNILILGKAGKGHAGADLTDTIIFASVAHAKPLVTMVSLPRDIWIPEIRAKINSAYFWGNQKEVGGGLVLAKSTVEEIVGVPIQYGVVIDFSGFKKVIDAIGGIEVDVERSFVDEKYPIAGKENDDCGGKDPEFMCRYETIKFATGKQMMDGETALKFVRSRNAQGDEGTDLARAARQQKVLSSLRQKILSPYVLLSPRKVLAILAATKESVETDIDTQAGAILARRILQAGRSANSHVLPEEFLVNPPVSARYDNQYVFIPRKEKLPDGRNDWGEVHEWIKTILH